MISFSFFMARAALVSPTDVNLGLLVTQLIVMPWLEEHPNPTPETAWGWGVSVWRDGLHSNNSWLE